MDLKAISCRIEWSVFQVHSTKHTQVVIFIINLITKPLKWCFSLKGIYKQQPRFPLMHAHETCILNKQVGKLIHGLSETLAIRSDEELDREFTPCKLST